MTLETTNRKIFNFVDISEITGSVVKVLGTKAEVLISRDG